MSEAFDLRMTYLALDRAGAVTKMPGGAAFWQTVADNPAANGTLITASALAADSQHWEMHPKGDEIVMLIDGDVDFIFETERGEEINRMGPGEAIIVPRGVWHRAAVRKPGRMLYITLGEGTMQKPV